MTAAPDDETDLPPYRHRGPCPRCGGRGPIRVHFDRDCTSVAASMLAAAYHMLRTQTHYRDLGGAYFDRRDKRRVAVRLVRRLNQLGYAVELHSAA